MTALTLVSGSMAHDLHPMIAAWCTWMRAQSWSERTIADRAWLVHRVAASAGVEPHALTTENVVDFLAMGTFSATSRQTYYASLRTWFRWQVETGRLEDHPMDTVRRPRAGRRAVRSLRTEHLEHLLASRIKRRTRAMVLLMAYQGLRCFEVAKIRGRDLDLISRELVVVGKGDVHSILPLHPVIAELSRDFGPGYWFPQRGTQEKSPILAASVGRIVGDAMKRVGVPGTAHSLRHWYATELLRAGVDTRVTQELMRHASMATTQRYLHVDDTQRRDAVLLLPHVA